jgi:serine protease Do
MSRFALTACLIVALVVGHIAAPGIVRAELPSPNLSAISDEIAQIADKSSPAVVSIISTKIRKRSMINPYDRLFGVPSQPRQGTQMQMGMGSGFIIDSSGIILTNNHVVADVDDLEVHLNDGRTMKAEVIGTDPDSEVALIKIDAKELPILEMGDSSKMKVGNIVFAIGSPQGLPETLTMGLVSALNRPLSRVKYANFIQTDAAINPGNSGGPLLDVHGRVIGINTAIYSTSGGSQGVGFAIPINEARRIADQLMDTGEIRRGFIGIVMSNLTPEMAEHLGTKGMNGAVVTQILDESPAKGKLRVNDAIVGLNDVPLRDSMDLRNTVASMNPGDRIKLDVVRNGRQEEINLRLIERPDEKARHEAKEQEKEEPEKPVEEEVDTLGFSVRPIDEKVREEIGFEVDKGLLITNVKARSNAQMEGIEPGMVVLQVNQKKVGSIGDLRDALREGRDRATVLLLIRTARGDQLILLGKSNN